MFKRLFRGLSKLVKSIFGSPRPPVNEPPPLPPKPIDIELGEPETEFIDFGYEGPDQDFVEVVARASYRSKKGKVGAEVHFFLERNNTYTAKDLQEIFQIWVATGKTPKDVEMKIIDWTATTTDDRGRETTNTSEQYQEAPEHSLNRGLRAALRKAHIDF